ncbi:uncharacterized protein LOC126558679 [Anopheles maculipalpis]|uniref:uncharacterized protein LOC126558679 n=1 Tax=Anopheles maculipalpis TaxID=1496333 RepID=UPI002159547F|nr:uncharacterized protein LOC126558679 [Anopheles maculipalpis]
MGTDLYRCSFTWPRVEGSIEKQITPQVVTSSEPDFIPLEELLDLEMCLILSGTDEQEACEMRLTFAPLYLPRAVSLVVECPVIECYYSRLNEYHSTCHGELVYTLEDVKVFRFDIRIGKDIDELQLKFISNKGEPLCLYGTRLYLTRNTDPLRTMMAMMGGRKIDPVAVQNRLQATDLSEKAEKCKRMILGSMLSSEQNIVNNNAVPEVATKQETDVPPSDKTTLPTLFSKMELQPGTLPMEMVMKQYIDAKFIELKQLLDNRLSALEARQNTKLDRILTLLQGGESESTANVE